MPPDTPPKHPGMPKHPETSPQNTKKHRKTAPALKTRTIAPISSNAQASIEDAKTMIPPKAEPPPASPFPHHNVKEQTAPRRMQRHRRTASTFCGKKALPHSSWPMRPPPCTARRADIDIRPAAVKRRQRGISPRAIDRSRALPHGSSRALTLIESFPG